MKFKEINEKRKLTIPEQHQLKIAKKTIKMTPEMANILGGMTYNEAVEIIKKFKER